MKRIATILSIVLTTITYAQNVGVNSTGAAANPSALLDVDASPNNDKGLLIPRVTLVAVNNPAPITAPVISLIVYNTATAGVPPNNVSPGFYYWNGTKWVTFGAPSSPAGEVIAYAGRSAPTGYLLCDGSPVSRTTYANLFAAIDTMYGAGNGSTTFNLPNYQGYFLRGTNHGSGNDPDAATRTNRGDGVTGDSVGTKQDGQIQSHTHTISGIYGAPNPGGGDSIGGNSRFGTTTVSATGGNETRPKNINVLYCIKY